MTAKEAVELGLVAEIDNYQAVQAVEEPEKVTSGNYSQPLHGWQCRSDKEKEREEEMKRGRKAWKIIGGLR